MRARCSERGSILPLVALVVLAGGGLMLGVGRLGADAVQRNRAVLAADAAALAGAAEGEDAAREVAAANDGELQSFHEDGVEVEVTVRVRDAEATARARRIGGSFSRIAPPGRDGLSPALLAAMARAEQLLGERIPVTQGLATESPHMTTHKWGMAIDVQRSFVPLVLTVAARAGLCQPAPDTHPVHFEPCRWSRAAG